VDVGFEVVKFRAFPTGPESSLKVWMLKYPFGDVWSSVGFVNQNPESSGERPMVRTVRFAVNLCDHVVGRCGGQVKVVVDPIQSG
jgi:hypothetical protein